MIKVELSRKNKKYYGDCEVAGNVEQITLELNSIIDSFLSDERMLPILNGVISHRMPDIMASLEKTSESNFDHIVYLLERATNANT